MPSICIQLRGPCVEISDLVEVEAAQIGNERIERGRDVVNRQGELAHVGRSLRRHDAVLGEMAAQRIDELGALPDQKVARSEDHGSRLLSLALDRDEVIATKCSALGL